MDWEIVACIVVILWCDAFLFFGSQDEAENARKHLRRLQAIELETIAAQAELERITGRG